MCVCTDLGEWYMLDVQGRVGKRDVLEICCGKGVMSCEGCSCYNEYIGQYTTDLQSKFFFF